MRNTDGASDGKPGVGHEAHSTRRLLVVEEPLATARRYLPNRLLLTPNERAASALRGGRAEHKSLSGLAEDRLVTAGWLVASEVAQLTALRRAVRDSGELGVGSASVAMLGSAVRELLLAGLGRDGAVAAELQSAPELSERTKAMVQVALHYREVLAEGGTIDPAEALSRAVLLEARPLPVVVAGYPRVGLAELVFLDSVAAKGSVFVLPAGFEASATAARVLGERGWEVENAAGRPAEEPASSHLGVDLARSFTASFGVAPGPAPSAADARFNARRLPSQEDEVRWALTEVKRFLREGVDQREITLIARDELLYGPLVEAVAWEFGVPLKLSYSVPIRSTRLGELLAGVSTAIVAGLPFEATARLLSHPLLRALDSDAWTAARKTHPAGAAAWREITPVTALLSWPQRTSVERYRSHLQRLLDEGGAITRLSEREDRVRRRLELALGEYDQRTVMPLAGFLGLVDELLAVLTVSVDPPAKRGVEFHSPLAVFGASYEHVFVLGAAEGMLPAPLGNDPLLDFFERDLIRGHGLPLEDAMEASERENLSFMAAVLTARSSLTMSFPELLDNREQIASPFYAALGAPRPEAPGPRPAASGTEHLMLTLREQRGPPHRAWEVEYRRESDAPPDVFDGIIGAPVDIANHTFSASQLATLGQCAFRWFAQRRLRLAEPEEAEEDVSPMLLGSIYHKTLELVVRHAWAAVGHSAGGPGAGEGATISTGAGGVPGAGGIQGAKTPATRTGWDEATTSAFRQAAIDHLDAGFDAAQVEEGIPKAASWPLQRREHLAKLTRVIRADDFLLPQTEVVRLEGRFKGTWRGFPVLGFVDRVDDGPTGLVLTDYKTGKSAPLGAKNSKGEPKLDLQLPLYVQTAAPDWFGSDHPVTSARYFSINGAETLSESKIDEYELQHFVERAMAILGHGDFPVDPDVEQKVCAYCDFDAVCRRGPRLGRKRQRAERDGAEAGESLLDPTSPRVSDGGEPS